MSSASGYCYTVVCKDRNNGGCNLQTAKCRVYLSGVQFGLQWYEWLTKSDDREAGVWFVNHELITDGIGGHESCYQLIMIITISKKQKSAIWKIAFNYNFSFMVSTISEKINEEKSFKNGFKQPLEKIPALKGKFFSCYSDCILSCDWWI